MRNFNTLKEKKLNNENEKLLIEMRIARQYRNLFHRFTK